MFNIVTDFELKKLENEIKDSYMGVVYALEYGKYVKIGSTKNPFLRYKSLKHTGANYGDFEIGKMAISPVCTNYFENEKKLHKYFNTYRKQGTELFSMSLNDILDVSKDCKVLFIDESEQIENDSLVTLEKLKKTLGWQDEEKLLQDFHPGKLPSRELDESIELIERLLTLNTEVETLKEELGGLLYKCFG